MIGVLDDLYLKNIADAIRNKTGETGDIPVEDMAEEINNIPAPIDFASYRYKFYDFDGTFIKGYHNRTELAEGGLPTPPDHSHDTVPLTFIEWNWSLNRMLEEERATAAAFYRPTDGYNHFKINVIPTAIDIQIQIEWPSGEEEFINWGDGTTNTDDYHLYSEPGSYWITTNAICPSFRGSNVCLLEEAYWAPAERYPDITEDAIVAKKLLLPFITRSEGPTWENGQGRQYRGQFLALQNIPRNYELSLGGRCSGISFSEAAVRVPRLNENDFYAGEEIVIPSNVTCQEFKVNPGYKRIYIYGRYEDPAQKPSEEIFGWQNAIEIVDYDPQNISSMTNREINNYHSLKELWLPASLTTAHSMFVGGCEILEKVYLRSTTLTCSDAQAFDKEVFNYLAWQTGSEDFKIYVPENVSYVELFPYQDLNGQIEEIDYSEINALDMEEVAPYLEDLEQGEF